MVSSINHDSKVFFYCPLMMAEKPHFPQEKGEWLRRKAKPFWRDTQVHKALLCSEADGK